MRTIGNIVFLLCAFLLPCRLAHAQLLNIPSSNLAEAVPPASMAYHKIVMTANDGTGILASSGTLYRTFDTQATYSDYANADETTPIGKGQYGYARRTGPTAVLRVTPGNNIFIQIVFQFTAKDSGTYIANMESGNGTQNGTFHLFGDGRPPLRSETTELGKYRAQLGQQPENKQEKLYTDHKFDNLFQGVPQEGSLPVLAFLYESRVENPDVVLLANCSMQDMNPRRSEMDRKQTFEHNFDALCVKMNQAEKPCLFTWSIDLPRPDYNFTANGYQVLYDNSPALMGAGGYGFNITNMDEAQFFRVTQDDAHNIEFRTRDSGSFKLVLYAYVEGIGCPNQWFSKVIDVRIVGMELYAGRFSQGYYSILDNEYHPSYSKMKEARNAFDRMVRQQTPKVEAKPTPVSNLEPNTILQSAFIDIASKSNVIVGQASAGNMSWPFEITMFQCDKDNHFTASLNWKTLHAIHKIEGVVYADRIEYREVAYIKKGDASLDCVYSLKLVDGQDNMNGTWHLPGTSQKGAVVINLALGTNSPLKTAHPAP
jgi:hypothetical protein